MVTIKHSQTFIREILRLLKVINKNQVYKDDRKQVKYILSPVYY